MSMSDARKVELIDLIAKNQFQINLLARDGDLTGFLSVMPAMDGEESEEYEFSLEEGQEESYLTALEKALTNWGKEHARGTIFWQRKQTCPHGDGEKIDTLDFMALNRLSVCIALDGESDDGRERLGVLTVESAWGGESTNPVRMVVKKGDMESYMAALGEALDEWDAQGDEPVDQIEHPGQKRVAALSAA